jgi:hypothetical protein
MKPILCLLGLHDWLRRDEWEPSIDAPVVTLLRQTMTCARCGEERIHESHFPPPAPRKPYPPAR